MRSFSRNSGPIRCDHRRARSGPPSPSRGHGRQAHVATLGSGRGMVLEWAPGRYAGPPDVYDGFPRPGTDESARAGNAAGARHRRGRRLVQRDQTIPRWSAFRTARVRSRTPSWERMFETWFFTVPSATPSEFAISLLL